MTDLNYQQIADNYAEIASDEHFEQRIGVIKFEDPDDFVLTLSNPGDIILDPFCGSGTTLAVARRLGRNAIGIDVRESQIELTRQWLAESVNS